MIPRTIEIIPVDGGKGLAVEVATGWEGKEKGHMERITGDCHYETSWETQNCEDSKKTMVARLK